MLTKVEVSDDIIEENIVEENIVDVENIETTQQIEIVEEVEKA